MTTTHDDGGPAWPAAVIDQARLAVRAEVGSQLCDWHRGKQSCQRDRCECEIVALSVLGVLTDAMLAARKEPSR